MAEAANRSLTTSIVVLHPTRSELLCVRHPRFGTWMFPGGRVEAGEVPHEAALREVREEVGLDVELVDLSGLPSWSARGNRRLPQPFAMIEEALPEGGYYVDVVYVGIAADEAIRLRAEVTKARWFDQLGLAQVDTSFPIKEIACEILKQSGLRPSPAAS